ncbi:uncharacterized protein CDAR_605121 [Caerostris darwini]|uniref:Uncharacterized protein n=1 Tax=Caerostris darwini TaxID=1538125 RepID=A0AAV4X874_9ARAC|nr:uncharacterized protein CDAR_605121 [Caerostris darwini]
MRLFHVYVLLIVSLIVLLPVSSTKSSSNKQNEVEGRRFLNLGSFRPFMRVLGMMGIPLLPLLLLRQLIGAGGGASVQGGGGGAGLGSMGALGLIGPFGAGAGLGGLGPLGGGGGIRPLGGLRPLGGGGLRPFGGLIANAAANAAQNAAGGAAGGGSNSLFLRKRSTEQGNNSRLSNFMGALAKLEKVVDKYDLSVPDCQRRLICEVHKSSINPSFGSFTEKLIQAFGVEARLEKSRFTSNTKSVLKDFLKAARNGLQHRECSAIYYKCPIAIPDASHENYVTNPSDP